MAGEAPSSEDRFERLKTVLTALSDLSRDDQQRILTSVATFLGLGTLLYVDRSSK